jgi:hypothetical protein
MTTTRYVTNPLSAFRYGQRALVNENVGSLVNTLTLYQHTDLRLEAFARQLSEEWDVSIFLDFLIAQNLCLQVRFDGMTPGMCMPCSLTARYDTTC